MANYKLFTEKIGVAIEEYKNDEGWVSTSNKDFVRAIFSGHYSAKDLDNLIDLIKRHNQSFRFKEENGQFYVALKKKNTSEQKTNDDVLTRIWHVIKQCFAQVYAFILKIVDACKEKIASRKHESGKSEREDIPNSFMPKAREFTPKHKTSSSKKDSQRPNRGQRRNDENNSKPSERKPQKSASQPTQKENKSSVNEPKSKPKEDAQKRDERNKTSEKPKAKQPAAANNEPKKENNNSESAIPLLSLSDQIDLGSNEIYEKACVELLSQIHESLFVFDLKGEYNQPKVSLPVYIRNIYTIRTRYQQLVENEKFLIFDLGIEDKNKQPIYFVAEKNNNEQAAVDASNKQNNQAKPYKFVGFSTQLNGEAAALVAQQNEKGATLYPFLFGQIKPAQLLYDASIPIVWEKNLKRLLLDNLLYLPKDILENHPALKNIKEEYKQVGGFSKRRYLRSLPNRALSNKEAFAHIYKEMQNSIEKSFRLLLFNPLFAVLDYNVLTDKPGFVVPLAIGKTPSPHLMLEITYTDNKYELVGIMPISRGTLSVRNVGTLPSTFFLSLQTPIL